MTRLVDEITHELDGLVNEIADEFQGTSDDILLRKLRLAYENIPYSTVTAIMEATGHEDLESEPCRACKVNAAKEFALWEA